MIYPEKVFFRRPDKKQRRDLEQLIFDIAEHNKDEDFHLLYQQMVAREVFVPVRTASIPSTAQPGLPYVTQREDRMRMNTIELPGHGYWAPAATQTSCKLLEGGYVGMPWLGYLAMVQKTEGVSGAFLQGQTSWIAFDKQRLTYILSLSAT